MSGYSAHSRTRWRASAKARPRRRAQVHSGGSVTNEADAQAANDRLVAERVLATTFGRPVLLDLIQAPEGGSGRANLRRCFVRDGPGDAPASVIVKRVALGPEETYDPAASAGPSIRLFNEWASLEFLTTIAPGELAPRFYGGDR